MLTFLFHKFVFRHGIFIEHVLPESTISSYLFSPPNYIVATFNTRTYISLILKSVLHIGDCPFRLPVYDVTSVNVLSSKFVFSSSISGLRLMIFPYLKRETMLSQLVKHVLVLQVHDVSPVFFLLVGPISLKKVLRYVLSISEIMSLV